MSGEFQWWQRVMHEVASTSYVKNHEAIMTVLWLSGCVVTVTTATHECWQMEKKKKRCLLYSSLGEGNQSQSYHPWKDGAELHLAPCGFDVVWAGRQHAQIPVILRTKTALHCLIVADTPPAEPLLPLVAVVLGSLQEMWHRYRTQTVFLEGFGLSRSYTRQLYFLGLGGNPAWDS